MAEGPQHFQLPVPDEATSAEQAVEVLRAWIINKQLTLTLAPTVFDNPQVWGTLLADTAFHISSAIAQTQPGHDVPNLMKLMQQSFNTKITEAYENPGEIAVVQG